MAAERHYTVNGFDVNTRGQLMTFKLGDRVNVGAFGRTYAGNVVKLGYLRVHVTFVTGTGLEHTRAYNPREVSHV